MYNKSVPFIFGSCFWFSGFAIGATAILAGFGGVFPELIAVDILAPVAAVLYWFELRKIRREAAQEVESV